MEFSYNCKPMHQHSQCGDTGVLWRFQSRQLPYSAHHLIGYRVVDAVVPARVRSAYHNRCAWITLQSCWWTHVIGTEWKCKHQQGEGSAGHEERGKMCLCPCYTKETCMHACACV
eukprot:464525-Pelagomonas_calceolata.AAC.1